MTRLNRLAILGLSASLLVLTACPGKDKEKERCEKMADKAFEVAQEMGKAMAKMLPADQVATMEKEMKESMAKERPAMIEGCIKAVKENPEIIEVMDCTINAPDLQAASKCDPEGKLKALNKNKPAAE